MKISDIQIEELNIPLKISFEHSTASRSETESVLVKTHTGSGHTGLGEGCPRSYVTGESISSALKFFSKYESEFITISSVSKLKEWITTHKIEIDNNPAAFSATEISLLNALALDRETSIEQLLEIPKIAGKFHYTAVLGTRDAIMFHSQLKQYKAGGFKDYKVKLFGDLAIDLQNMNLFSSEFGTGIRLRFDANNLWTSAVEAIDYLEALNTNYFAIEEPITANKYEDLKLIYKALDKKIILDESFLKSEDFQHIREDPLPWIINLRISKMGGIIRSLSIAAEARELGIPLIIGAQVGETSILTRAALMVASSCRKILIAQEGAYGTHLLSYDLVDPPISFGAGGILEIPKD